MVKWLSRLAAILIPSSARAAGIEEGRRQVEESGEFQSRRLMAEYLRHFLGASEDRRRPNWYETSMAGDVELMTQLPTLRNRSRLMVDTDGKAGGLVHKEVTNTIGPGFTVQARLPREFTPGAVEQDKAVTETLVKLAEAWWQEKVDVEDNQDADWKRERTFLQVIRLAFKHFKADGELFLRFYARPGLSIPFCLQIVEAECVGTPPKKEGDPYCRHGKQYSKETGELLGFWVCRAHPGDIFSVGADYEWVPAWNEFGLPNMLHLFDPRRETDSRGLPWLYRVLVPLNDSADYKDSELQRKRVEADIAIIVGLANPDKFADSLQTDGAFGQGPTTGATRSSEARSWQTRGRKIVYTNKGETVTTVDPQRPGATFEPFTNSLDRDIGAGVGRSFERVANNYGAANFSATRVSGIEDYVEHETEFEVFAGKVLCPIWAWAMWSLALVSGQGDVRRLKARFSRYVKPSWDPEVDANAAKTRIESHTSSIVEECGQRGLNYEEVQDNEIRAEKRRRERRKAAGLPEEQAPAAPIDGAIDAKIKKAGKAQADKSAKEDGGKT